LPLINVVDDDESIRFMLKLMLERAGYDVVEAESGEECLEKFDSIRPDLILLDIKMTGIDGWDVCKQIKERIPAILIPISMLSGMKTEEDLRRSFEYAHADAHIKKPFDSRELLGTVKILLEKSSRP
jgi:DNA-binding response OmpR family regulator